MAHFAEIDSSNTVIRVIVIDDSQQANGEAFCQAITGSSNTWLQTSYNTIANTHLKGGTPFRKNYASIGHTYHTRLDAFIPPKKFPSWVLDEETGTWVAPKPRPEPLPFGTINKSIRWNESVNDWVVVDDDIKVGFGQTAYFDELQCKWVVVDDVPPGNPPPLPDLSQLNLPGNTAPILN